MATTKAAIRRRAVHLAKVDGRSRGFSTRDGSTALSTTAGAALTFTDTAALPPTGASSTLNKGDWVLWPTAAANADRMRILASYDGATRTFTHSGPAVSGAHITSLGTGLPYLILKDHPDLWDSALNEALRAILSTIKYDEWTPTATRARYTVSAAPITLTGIVRDSQILALDTHSVGEAAGEEAWAPWANGYRSWRSYMDEQSVILDFGSTDRAPTTSDVMRIKWADQYAIPATETASIAVDELWAAYGTLVVMAKWLGKSNDPDNDWNMIGRDAAVSYAAQRRLILGEDGFRRVTRTAQATGIGGVRGRGGRWGR